jgi:hypothetical protein
MVEGENELPKTASAMKLEAMNLDAVNMDAMVSMK